MSANGVIPLADFAKELGLDKSGAKRAIQSLSKDTGREYLLRARVRGNQPGWALTREAADEVLDLRRQRGFVEGAQGSAITTSYGQPTVYVLRLNGNRVKVGYTDSLDQRLMAHRTLVPDLTILRQWPLPQAYEVVMLDVMRCAPGMVEIGPEVFEGDSTSVDKALLQLDGLVTLVKPT